MAHCSHPSIEEREDVMLPARQHKGPREIEGRISEERPDLAAGDTTIYRAVWPGWRD